MPSVLLLCSTALAFCGIWRVGNTQKPNTVEQDQQLYYDRIAEIDSDFDLGRIDKEVCEAAKAEQARLLLHASRRDNTSEPQSRALTFYAVAAAMIFVPVLSIGIYTVTGAPEYADFATGQSDKTAQPAFEDLMAAAENQLDKNPDDLRGWRVVAPV